MSSASTPSRTAVLARVLWLTWVLAIAFTLPARADAPATVRIQAFAIEAGWHEGRLGRDSNGCTIVQLSPAAAGASSVTLAAVDWLEVRRQGRWSTVLVQRLLAKDPAACRQTRTAEAP